MVRSWPNLSICHGSYGRILLALNEIELFCPAVCPNLKTLNETSGVITSPFHPRKYPANQRCSWQITASKGKRIVLDIEYMSIEYCGACSCDYLEIEHGLSSDGISIGRKCGHGRVAYYSFGEILKVVFVSNSNSNRYSGFRATYTQVNFTGVVPGKL